MTLVKFKNNYPGSLQSDFPMFFQDMMDRFWPEEPSMNWNPSTNIIEREKDFKIEVAAPGIKKDDFKIEVENNILTIQGTRKEEISEEKNKVTRKEFHYGSFKRSFTLPETVDSDKISAAYNDGILILTLAKKESILKESKKAISVL